MVDQMMSGITQLADIWLLSFTSPTWIMAAVNLPQQSLITLPLQDFSVASNKSDYHVSGERDVA